MSTPYFEILEEIRKRGPIPFARFMELALYAPGSGFYERNAARIGRAGDFYTSVSVGPFFGELLALFARERMGAEGAPRLAEAGAHDGQLARDILTAWKRNAPESFAQLEYFIVEPSTARRNWQEKTLSAFQGRVRWVAAVEELPPACLFLGNELLDAFPVHRLAWVAAAQEWRECFVDEEEGQLSWVLQPLSDASLRPDEIPDQLLPHLPDGWIWETSPAAERWWSRLAGHIRSGVLLVLDYGLTLQQSLVPERLHGTLRAYRGHQLSADLLAHPGEQDLTAHVAWWRIQEAGERHHWRSERLVTQEQFLSPLLARISPTEFTQEKIRQFQTLTHPDLLGRRFQVLVQTRREEC